MIPRWLVDDLEAYTHGEDTDVLSKAYLEKLANDPIYKLADFLGCDPEIIDDALCEYPSPEEETPEAHASYKQSIFDHTRIANLASSLAQEINRSESSSNFAGQKSKCGVTANSLENLARICYENANGLGKELQLKSRKGGKRRDAIVVASVVYDVFIATGRPISAQHVSGSPVTEFGKTVAYALKLWNVSADWRRASEAVVKGERAHYASNLRD